MFYSKVAWLAGLLAAAAPAVALAQGDVEPAAPKAWTFLVFLNADNNLDGAGVDDLNEMKTVGSTDQVNVVVQMDRLSGPASRLFVKKGGVDQLEALGEVDMGDFRQLVSFATWGIKKYPAQRYALVIWNHGSGWDKRRASTFRGISYDDTNGGHITTPQMGQALAQIAAAAGQKVDVLGCDACLMNMIEVGYEVRASIGAMVGSEETEPGAGWPYDRLLSRLVAKPAMGAEEFAAVVVEQYGASYGTQSTTQSALRARAFEDLARRLDEFAAACKAAGEDAVRPAIDGALSKVCRFYVEAYVDLFHFMDLFAAKAPDAATKAAARAVLACEGDVVSANKVSGLPFLKKKARGISIWFPEQGGYYSSYGQLAFAAGTQWDDFLRWYRGLAVDEAPGDRRLEAGR